MTAIRTVETVEARTGGYLTVLKIENHDVYVYAPKDVMESDIINYGYSAPLLLVFPDRKLDREEAVDYAEETGLARIASENGGTVIFANPLKDWENESEGLYERIVDKTKISQWGFCHGILYDDKVPKNRFMEAAMKRPGFDPVPEYFIFGSPVAAYVYGKDAGADYLFHDIEGSGSTALSIERVLDRALTAQVWLIKHHGKLTREQIVQDVPALRNIPAKISLCDTFTSGFYEETPFHPDLLLGNLIQILHPELGIQVKKAYFCPLE